MQRMIASLLAAGLLLAAGVAFAQTPMKPTAPQKMMSPAEAKKMHACEALAEERNVKMDERAKFIMDCMTAAQK